MSNVHQFPKATRLEVIDSSGRALVRHYAEGGVEVHVQDEGQTVKVFCGQPVSPFNALGLPSSRDPEESVDVGGWEDH